jgi:hypothetical protein
MKARIVLIVFNTYTQKIEYVIGSEFITAENAWDDLLDPDAETDVLSLIPAHVVGQTPLGAIALTGATTSINWTSIVDNILDLRWIFNDIEGEIATIEHDIHELQLRTGFDPLLTTTGAATDRASSYRSNSGQIQSTPVSSAGPTDNQVLAYNAQHNRWEPAAQATGTAGSGQFSATIGASNTWNNETIPIWQGPIATSATITEILATTSGTLTNELNFNLQHRDWDAMQSAGTDIFGASQLATSAGEQITSFTRDTIDPRAHLMFTTGSGAETGSVNYLQLTLYYTV